LTETLRAKKQNFFQTLSGLSVKIPIGNASRATTPFSKNLFNISILHFFGLLNLSLNLTPASARADFPQCGVSAL
jgi:hypothetical protein